jgi:membrane-bound lytic murein transglycosylase MltF
VPTFDWNRFDELLATRKHLIDEQLMDTLLSLHDKESFRAFIKDFRNSYEEEEQLKVLTIKSNKITESKTVKGRDNIFSQGGSLLEKGLKPLPKKKEAQEKTEAELLVPGLILTVKGMRKG